MEVKKNHHKAFLPILNRGTWSRVYSILSPVQKILQSVSENNPGVNVNILSLGSGYDTSYFLLKQKFDNFKFFEFDYGEITSRKIELIKKSKLLQSVLKSAQDNSEDLGFEVKANNLYSKSKDYYILECDITNYNKLNEQLCSVPDFDFTSPTIIIAECLLVYLKKETTHQMLQNFTMNFKNLVFLLYDLVGANDNFGKEMVINLLDRDIKLFGYEDVPDVGTQIDRLLKTGFTKAEVCDMLEYYVHCIPLEERKRIEHLEFVDEFEEFNLLQNHACFGYGTKLEDKFDYLNDAVKIK